MLRSLDKILYATKFGENSDLGSTCLGKINIRSDMIKAGEKFPTLEECYTLGKLLDGTVSITFGHWSKQMPLCPKHIM